MSRQLTLVEALNSLTQISLAHDDAQTLLQAMTDIVGKTLAVDHCLLYEIDVEQQQAITLCEWLNPQCPELTPTKAVYNLDLFMGGYRNLQVCQAWLESHRDSVNPSLLEDGSAAFLHEQMHTNSLLWYSFYFHQDSYYLLVFNQVSYRREWQQEELTFIKTVANLVSIALQKIRLLTERQQAEEALKKANKELEIHVEKRTLELRNTIERLQTEIAISETSRKTCQESEDALQTSEHQFRAIFEKTAIGMGVVDLAGQLIASNPALHKIIGYSPEELLTMSLVDYTHPDDAVVDLALYQQLLAGKCDYYQMEKRFIKKDGQLFWGRLTVSAIRSAQNEIQFTFGTVEDINERKQAEEALRQSEARFRGFVENANDIIYSLTTEAIFSYVSPNWTDILGHDVSEVEGKPFPAFVHPEDLPMCLSVLNKVVETAHKQAGIEYRVKHQDGSWRWHTSNVSVSKDADSKILYLIGIARDITEHKQAHQALRQSEARSREQAQQLEQALQELQQAQSQLLHTEKMSSLGQLVAGVAHEINNPVTFIYSNLTPTSEYTQDLLRLLHLYQQHYPHPVPEIQAEMEAIDLDFLVEDLPKILSSMRIGADRIREIVVSLRNFSRLGEAEIKSVELHEGINNTLLILQNRLRAKAGHPGIQVLKEYGSLPKVQCYAGQINQVFLNILTNAIDALEDYNSQPSFYASADAPKIANADAPNVANASPSPSLSLTLTPEEIQQNRRTIRIRTEVSNSDFNGLSKGNQQWVTIRIADNGPGMTQAVKQRIFDPFFTTKPVGQGTGLGLSISYQIVVDKHGGQLWCDSAPGQGTEFFIEIPVFYKHESA